MNLNFISKEDFERVSKDTLGYLQTNAMKLGVPTALFYSCCMISQRLFGLLSLHGGRPRFIVSIGGASAAALSLYATHTASSFFIDEAYYKSTKYLSSNPTPSSSTSASSIGWLRSLWPFGGTVGGSMSGNSNSNNGLLSRSSKEYVDTIKSFGLFLLIEHRLFRTMAPSSVLTIGVFANTSLSSYRSVHSSSEVATASERNKIQKLGEKFGCHHCGSKMALSRGTFIADHMPPTKYAKEMNSSWWRRLMGLKVSQRLWAQCQSCFSMQGSAVRASVHRLAYFSRLRLVHFVPSLTLMIDDFDFKLNHYF